MNRIKDSFNPQTSSGVFHLTVLYAGVISTSALTLALTGLCSPLTAALSAALLIRIGIRVFQGFSVLESDRYCRSSPQAPDKKDFFANDPYSADTEKTPIATPSVERPERTYMTINFDAQDRLRMAMAFSPLLEGQEYPR